MNANPDQAIHEAEIITAYKCTRSDGTDYRTGKLLYAPGAWLVEPNTDTSDAECGPGLHVNPTIWQTLAYIDRSTRGFRAKFFEVAIRWDDLMSCGPDKLRCRIVWSRRKAASACLMRRECCRA